MADDSWSLYSSGQHAHDDYPGVLHESKVYIVDFSNPEVLDTQSNEWSSLPSPQISHDPMSCLLSWRDSLILIGSVVRAGGGEYQYAVEMFDVASQSWRFLDTSAPLIVHGSGCAVLPNGEIIILGSCNDPYRNASFIYNVEKNEWRQVGDSSYDRCRTSLVVLGARVFAVGGFKNPSAVEEFNAASKSWTLTNSSPIVPRNSHSMVAVPPHLFADLPGGCSGLD